MRRLLCLTLLLSGLFLAPSAFAADLVAIEQARVYADSHAGRTAWSSFDTQERVHRLVTVEDGRVVATDAPSSPHPFRLDVGPGPDGEPVAVYPRCTDEVACDLFLYDFATRRERRLRVSTKEASESLPSIWGSRIAFARRAGGVSTMWIADLDGKDAAQIPGGRQTGPSGPLALELRGSRAAFVWSRQAEGGTRRTELFAYRAGRIRWLDGTSSSSAGTSTFVTPELRGRRVYYGRPATGRGARNQLRRADVDGKRVDYVRAPSTGIVTAVWLSDRFLLSRTRQTSASDDPEGECRAPGTAPSASVCRLLVGDRVAGWRRIPAGSN